MFALDVLFGFRQKIRVNEAFDVSTMIAAARVNLTMAVTTIQ